MWVVVTLLASLAAGPAESDEAPSPVESPTIESSPIESPATESPSVEATGPGQGAPSPAEPAAEVQKVTEADPWWKPLGGSATLDASVGVGTFVGSRTSDNPYYSSSLVLEPIWAFTEDLVASVNFTLTYEWTYLITPCHAASGPRPDGAPAEDCSDTDDPNRERASLEDIVLSISHSKLRSAGPFAWTAKGAIALPTSRQSRHTGNVFTLGIGTGSQFDYSPVSASLGATFWKYFPTGEAQALDGDEAQSDGPIPIARCASFRQTACIALGGFTSSWQLRIDSEVSVEIPWVPGLQTTVGFSYLYSARHGRAADDFRSPIVDAGGTLVVTGVNADDYTVGNVDIGYSFDDHVTVSIGTYSMQPARTADGKGIRFPFYDFISPAQNYTVWYLSGVYTL